MSTADVSKCHCHGKRGATQAVNDGVKQVLFRAEPAQFLDRKAMTANDRPDTSRFNSNDDLPLHRSSFLA